VLVVKIAWKKSTGDGTIEYEKFSLNTLYMQDTTYEHWRSFGDRRRDNINSPTDRNSGLYMWRDFIQVVRCLVLVAKTVWKKSTGNGTIEYEMFSLNTLYIQDTTYEQWQSFGDRRRDNTKDFETGTYVPKRRGSTHSSVKFAPEIRNVRK